MGVWLLSERLTLRRYFYCLLPLPIKGLYGVFSAPAWVGLIYFLVPDFFGSMVHHNDNIAYFAHAIGFLLGLGMVLYLKNKRSHRKTFYQ